MPDHLIQTPQVNAKAAEGVRALVRVKNLGVGVGLLLCEVMCEVMCEERGEISHSAGALIL